jgi:hypothetical protein
MAKIYIHVEDLQYSLQFGNIDLKIRWENNACYYLLGSKILESPKEQKFLASCRQLNLNRDTTPLIHDNSFSCQSISKLPLHRARLLD